MRALVQRVSQAAVTAEGEEVARIGPGLLVALERPSWPSSIRPSVTLDMQTSWV